MNTTRLISISKRTILRAHFNWAMRRVMPLAWIASFCIAPAHPAKAQSPTPLAPLPPSAIFDLGPTPSPELPMPIPSPTASGQRIRRSTATPYLADPFGPPVNLPPVYIPPTPTPMPSPSATPLALQLPPGWTWANLYSTPSEMRSRRPSPPFLSLSPGMLDDRATQQAEIRLVNDWRWLCLDITLTPMRSRASLASQDENTDQWQEDRGGERSPFRLLLAPRQSETFQLPSGAWKAERRAWLPIEPFPMRMTLFQTQELLPRQRYEARFQSEEEATLREELRKEQTRWREDRARTDPLARLGVPPPTPAPVFRSNR